MISTSDFRKGLKIDMDGQPYEIIEYQFVKPGKGVAFTRTRLKHLLTGNVVDQNIRSGEKMSLANTEDLEMSFLYQEGDLYTFMDTQTYDQLQIDKDSLGAAADYLVENTQVKVLVYNSKPIGVELPNFVVMQIAYCEPGIKGDTATGSTKPAKLSTGASVNVPLFVEQGEWIRIDTRNNTYMERVKK